MTKQDEVGEADVMLAMALAQVVKDVGRNLASEPRRVQGMVSDVLGADSHARRAEIDAVVLAAEEGIPEDILANRMDPATAMALLRDRGLDDAVASFAIEVWRFALGLLEADAEPPTLTNSLQRLHTSTPTDQVSLSNSEQREAEAAIKPLTVVEAVPLAAATAQFPQPTPNGEAATWNGNGAEPGPSNKPGRSVPRWPLLALPVVILLVAVGAFIWLQDDDAADSSATTQSPATAVTTTNQETTTVAPTSTVPVPTTVPAVAFAAEPTPLGDLTRTWSLEDGNLVSELTFVNTTAGDLSGTYYEVVPKSVTASADAIVSDPPPTVFRADPIISWPVVVPAGQTVVVRYHVVAPAGATQEMLATWQQEQITAATAFATERATPPTLTVTTPNETVVETSEADITGMTDPSPANVSVSVNGIPATVNPDGTWVAHITGLQEGVNGLATHATSVWGAPIDTISSITFTPPAPTPTTKPKKTTPTPTPPPGDPVPTAAPTVSLNGAGSWPACSPYTVSAATTNVTSGSWSSSNGGSKGTSNSFTTTFPNSASPYTGTVTYAVTGPGGSATKSVHVTITPGSGC